MDSTQTSSKAAQEDEQQKQQQATDNRRKAFYGMIVKGSTMGLTQLILRLEQFRWPRFRLSLMVPVVRDYTVFMRALQYNFRREFQQRSEFETENFESNFQEKYDVSAIGTTSYTLRGTYKKKVDDTEFIDFLVKFVRIDPATRKPTAIDEEVKEQFQHAISGGMDIARPSSLKPTEEQQKKSFSQSFTVESSYIDINNHTNFSVYLLFVENTATQAVAKGGVYSSATDEFNVDQIQSLTVYYEGESVLGDSLQVHTWESERGLLHFLTMKGTKVVNYVVIQLYDDADATEH